ncbi:hypothetical protein AJ79_01496 [Helicocarpus griseus UAMH5409]|uniref:Uncharacterized protein n=1 Tax=Helicocarpus griseus UAMH5409 TaxID=1447875 RepID=A0A2B7Y7J5_9EURO|nr:hypothetical protein AJ79_01496 [Helicocarpus griseus UAMH5409]
MVTALIERAGSGLRPWLASCWSCLWPLGDERAHHRPVQEMGVEREMKICHDQPHLVPPMKLTLYDDLPSPDRPQSRSSTISHWVAEGRTLASKATDRASLSSRRMSRRLSRKPTISAPSDFRRVNPPPSRLEPFRPLELSIYLPGNRLSDLPEFDNFDIDSPNRLEPSQLPKPPPKVFTPIDPSFSRDPTSPPFKISRKPIGSVLNRPQSVSGRIEVYDRRRTLPESVLKQAPPTTDNINTSNVSNSNIQHSRSMSAPLSPLQRSTIDKKEPPQIADSFLKEIGGTTSTPPQTTAHKATLALSPSVTAVTPNRHRKLSSDLKSPRSRKVTQWLFSKSNSPPTTASSQTTWTSSPPHTNHSAIHGRTFSESTISSFNNTATSARTLSLSSAITATTIQPPPSIQGTLDKDIESMTNFYISHNHKASVSRLEEPCPTVYETDGYREDIRSDRVGLAF